MVILGFSFAGIKRTFPVILLRFILGFHNFLRVYGNAEGDALNAFKAQLTDPGNVFQSWNASLPNPCSWFHITCDNENRITRVDLETASLSGQLVPELGQLTKLQYLELSINNITGRIPSELAKLTSLVSLGLYSNRLEGNIPDALGNLQKLRYLRLNNNSLTGTIPGSLTTIDSLQVLDLSNNFLRGQVLVNGSFSFFTYTSFANTNLTLPPIIPQAPRSPNSQSPSAGSSRFTGAIAGGVSAGVALLFAGPTIVIVWLRLKKSRGASIGIPAKEDPIINLRQLKRFSLRELQVATVSFNSKNILGLDRFAIVYKGRLADGDLVAVRRLNKEQTQGGQLQFQKEVEMIGMAMHRNLLRMKGFCITPTECLLVYRYMANGSVASCLRERRDTRAVLDWTTRERIALGSARGLAYLHDHCNPKIIHRDVKAANILLDDEFEAVVGDFGLAKLMDYRDTHVTTAVRGTTGHIAPKYLSSGRSSEKTDVFGYGVMLLELVTGQRAYDLTRVDKDNEVMLLDLVKGLLNEKKLETLVDANLEGNYAKDGVEKLIQIALLCTQAAPLDRPKMSEVVQMLEGHGLADKWEEWQEKEISRQEFSHIDMPYTYYINPNSNNPSNEKLSGPR